MEEGTAQQLALRILSRPQYGAEGLLDPSGTSTDWAWVFRWGNTSDNHGIVIVVKDLARAWAIRLTRDDVDFDTFAREYSDAFRLAFDLTATPPKPGLWLVASARVLANNGVGFVAGAAAAIGTVGLLRFLWSGVPTWILIVAAVGCALAIGAVHATLEWWTDRRLARSVTEELDRGRYAHLLVPARHMHIQTRSLAGVDTEVVIGWSTRYDHIRDVLARNQPEDLPFRLALIRMLRVTSTRE
ncbi:hypothetical protein [Nocardia altamirensis]|uniref:hypothetical protein n=1 Tax=Nocardia altamirensis TaxID=472158 RepID=UPI00083FF095|nr:hypothetical protein [Nocardia altamirensis]